MTDLPSLLVPNCIFVEMPDLLVVECRRRHKHADDLGMKRMNCLSSRVMYRSGPVMTVLLLYTTLYVLYRMVCS